jgi:carbonic anhydrase
MTEHDQQHLIDFSTSLKKIKVDPDPNHEADVLLLTCMDFRFFLTIAELMKGIKYDHVVLAGAALGAVQDQREWWGKTFFDHLDLAIDLHNVKNVFVMEHRDCGAYGPKGFGLLPANPDRDEERRVHMQQVKKLIPKIPDDLNFAAFLLEVPPSIQQVTFDQLIGED